MIPRNRYLNFIPYNPKRLFANWNFNFYSEYNFDSIASLDSAVSFPTQFFITKEKIKETSKRQEKKINLVITAVGTGSIVDLIEKDLDELQEYISTITLTDLRDIDLTRWKKINNSEVVLKKQIGNITDPAFIQSLSGDMFYGNELFGDIANRFIYKNNNKYYDIWIRAYSENRMPKLIEKQMKKLLFNIYYLNKFPDVFTPEIGKILAFDIAFKRRIFSYEIDYFYQLYPNDFIIPVADSAYEVLWHLYQRLSNRGTILFHDYGFFAQENLHLIENFAKHEDNDFVRNYYGEFTTDPSFDYAYHKLKHSVKNISIRKTADLVSKIINIPTQLVNLDGHEREASFFIDLIKDRFDVWKLIEEKNIKPIIDKFIATLKNNFNTNVNVDNFVIEINHCVNNKMSEQNILTIKKILLGFFNDDDHRFLSIELNK